MPEVNYSPYTNFTDFYLNESKTWNFTYSKYIDYEKYFTEHDRPLRLNPVLDVITNKKYEYVFLDLIYEDLSLTKEEVFGVLKRTNRERVNGKS
jgi:hypothetical protein